MTIPSKSGFIIKTHVESATGAALRVERVTLSASAQGLLKANSLGIQAAASAPESRSIADKRPAPIPTKRK